MNRKQASFFLGLIKIKYPMQSYYISPETQKKGGKNITHIRTSITD